MPKCIGKKVYAKEDFMALKAYVRNFLKKLIINKNKNIINDKNM